MKPSSSPSSTWRDLDVTQMADWPDAPRRYVLSLGALVLAMVLGYFLLLPKYVQWRTAQQQTVSLQQQYVQLSQGAKLQLQNNPMGHAGTIKVVSAQELSNWLSDFAVMTQAHGFKTLSIKPVYPSKDQAKAAGSDMLNDERVGQLNVSGEGEYANVLKWAAALSEREEILSVDEWSLQGMSLGRVRWQARVLFAKEPTR